MTDSAPREDVAAPVVEGIVDEWDLLEAVATGGHAVVHRGRRRHDGEIVAIKVLRPHLVRSRLALERFAREAEILQRLAHPAIVEVRAVGRLPTGEPSIVMEWLDGIDLARALAARGPFPLALAAKVLLEVGSALSAAHAAGVIHRDVKARNVMWRAVGDDHRVKLVDFGIAKFWQDETTGARDLTTSSMRLGTPEAMAPEQITGAPADARTDVYGLGVLAYYLLAGRPPFHAPTIAELEELHLGAPPPSLTHHGVSRELDDVVRRCLAKSPGDRPASIPEVLAGLDLAMRAEGQGWLVTIEVVFGEPDGSAIDDDMDRVADLLAEVRTLARARGHRVEVATGNLVAIGVASAAEAVALASDLEAARRRAHVPPSAAVSVRSSTRV